MQLDNVRALEEKYNCKIEFKNLTWNGVIESINVSILGGTPDCDIYMADLQFGLPAVLNGYAMPISQFADADSDIFTDQEVMTSLNVLGMDETYLFSQYYENTDAWMLGFNMDAINEAGLENPQDLYDRGEWTWDKFLEYCKVLTKDTDGDGAVDRYGYTGWWTNLFSYLLLSNGAQAAGEAKEGFSSEETREVLELINTLYAEGYARPWDDKNWDINNFSAADQEAVFWLGVHWVEQGNFVHDDGTTDFTIGMVPFPIGPHGNKDTNKTRVAAGNWMFIPVGTKDPDMVYDVYYDWCNWFGYGTRDDYKSYRDDTEWAENMMTSGNDMELSARNFDYLVEMSKKPYLDLWNAVGVDLGVHSLAVQDGTTPAQLQEEHSVQLQEALDAYLGK